MQNMIPQRLTRISLLFLILCSCDSDTSFKEYISKNHIAVNLTTPQTDFQDIFFDDIIENQVFFSSEEHAVSGNKMLEIRLLDYFVREAEVKYLLIEHGYCQAQRFNKYLENGDKSILTAELKGLKGTLSYTQEFFKYWQEVYQLNQKLSAENKIQVIGIDLDWLPSVHKYLSEEYVGIDLRELPSFQNLLNNYDSTKPKKEYLQVFEMILSEYNNAKNKDAFSEKQKFEINYIFQNLIHSIDAFSQQENLDIHRKRDQYMYDNFLVLWDRLPKGNFFGQWGLNHVYQSPQLNVNWLAYLLDTQENSPVNGKVVSMATYYKSCERIKWRSNETETLDNLTISDDSLGISLDNHGIYIFRLNAPNSPFMEELLWYGPHKPDTGVTTNYYEYMIIENEFSASKPYE